MNVCLTVCVCETVSMNVCMIVFKCVGVCCDHVSETVTMSVCIIKCDCGVCLCLCLGTCVHVGVSTGEFVQGFLVCCGVCM